MAANMLRARNGCRFLRYLSASQPAVQCRYASSSSTASETRQDGTKSVHVAKAKSEDNINDGAITFRNSKIAFQSKTSWEILRALIVLRFCSFDFLVDRNKELFSLGKRVLGKRLFRKVMKMSIYGHFVAGEDQEDIKPTIANLEKFGVGSILDYSVEDDMPQESADELVEPPNVPESGEDFVRFKPHKQFADRRKGVLSARTYFYEGEQECDRRVEVFLRCIDAAAGAAEDGFAAIKVTALGRPQILLKVSEILMQTQAYFDKLTADSVVQNKIGRSIAKSRFFEGLKKIGVEMDPTESERIFDLMDTNQSGEIDVIEWHEFLTPQLKLSQLFRAKPQGDEETGKPIISILTDEQLMEMDNMSGRLRTLAQHAEQRGVRLMVDAEQTYFQPAIRRLTVDLQREFNLDQPLVFNTYQCYLRDCYETVQADMELARREGFKFSAKLVRGAYMEQERLRAATLGYADPVHPNYEATSECYNRVLNSVLKETVQGRANLMVASHNEKSVRFTIQRMRELGIVRDQKTVFFGQLLGMADPITFSLGEAGYAAYKYVPYGPVNDVLPYLSRRAMENRGLLKGAQQERALFWQELKRRVRHGEFFYKPAVPT